MKLNLNFKLKNLAGEELAPETAGQLFANALAIGQSEKPMKMLTFAHSLYDNGEIEVDLDDLKLLEDFVSKHKTFTNIFKAELLSAIEKSKIPNK